MNERLLGDEFVGGFIFADMHASFKAEIACYSGSDDDDDKGQVHEKDIDLAFAIQLPGEDHAAEVEDHQQHQDLKPPGVIDQHFCGCRTEIIFNECGIPDRNGENHQQYAHKSP
jgi:hypothetical protein